MSSARVSYPKWTREEVLEALRSGIETLAGSFPVERAILFGSYARGEHTVASDIDLLVVYRGDGSGDAYGAIKRAIDLRGLEPHPVTVEEYTRRRSHFDRMTEGGEVIYPPDGG